jgi:hypothetical protein
MHEKTCPASGIRWRGSTRLQHAPREDKGVLEDRLHKLLISVLTDGIGLVTLITGRDRTPVDPGRPFA